MEKCCLEPNITCSRRENEYSQYSYNTETEICVNETLQCDGIEHCLNGEDEAICAGTLKPEKCLQNDKTDEFFYCFHGGCIRASQECDNHIDCGDKTWNMEHGTWDYSDPSDERPEVCGKRLSDYLLKQKYILVIYLIQSTRSSSKAGFSQRAVNQVFFWHFLLFFGLFPYKNNVQSSVNLNGNRSLGWLK